MFSLLSRLFATKSITTTKPRRFQPLLQGLERRDAMSCTVGLQDGTLTVNGDANDNHVQIIQDDANNQLKVIADGVEHVFTSSQVNKLVVDLKEGDDTLSWKLGNGSNFKFTKEADIYLGAGEDTAQFDISMGPL